MGRRRISTEAVSHSKFFLGSLYGMSSPVAAVYATSELLVDHEWHSGRRAFFGKGPAPTVAPEDLCLANNWFGISIDRRT